MSLQQASRSIEELLYTLTTTLNNFRSARGLRHLVNPGELSFSRLFGECGRTKDESYEKRSAAVGETRRCMLQLVDNFDGVAGAAEKMIIQINLLLNTLERFHSCCDTEVDDRVDRNDPDLQQQQQDFGQLRKTISHLKTSYDSFSASKETCKALTRSAITQVEDVAALTSSEVAAALTDFDQQRRRVEMKERQVVHATSFSTSLEDPTTRSSEFNLTKESEALANLRKKYIDSCGNAMRETHFALEMSSMTGWASSNVFFVHLSQLLGEMSESGNVIAANLLSIKNSQKISHQLTEEKRRMLQEQRAAGAAAGAAANIALNLFGEDATASLRTSSSVVTSLPPELSSTARSPTERLGLSPVNLDSLFQ